MRRVFFIILLAAGVVNVSAQVDTFEVRFNLNDPKLSSRSEEYIDQLLYRNKIHRGQKLIILGYADYLGSEEENMTLSEKRATQVKEYLITSGFKTEDINVCVGKGEIANTATDKEGKPDDRKVQIIIDKSKGQSKTIAKTNSTTKTVTPLFDMTVLKENDVVPLDRVFFESGSYEVTEASYIELGKLNSFLKKNPTVHVQIEGHMCCGNWSGGFTYKRDVDTGVNSLSGRRARAIYDFLISNGTDSNRLRYVGYGTTRPFVKTEITPADEAKNRRVAIRILQR